MRIEELPDGGAKIVLSEQESTALSASWLDIMAWAASALPVVRGMPWEISADTEAVCASFPDRASALAFLGRFVPGALSELARGIEGTAADYHEISEKDGVVTVALRYVGDAGGGDEEPHDATWSDYTTYAEAARELGFDPEMLHSDHDTVEVRLVPALTARVPA